ncbi:MAG: D-2-hydroxyacid dehydrogenase [Oscillospiraceae bacterium]|nr:D-2-hydroxyacid dehydrogenase [Oscillospiraceae bacterium]
MKIVILDAYVENPGDLSWEPVQALGDVTIFDQVPLDDGAIIRSIGDAEVVITNKTPIDARVLDACPGVRLVTILATGYNIIDVAHARKRGVAVCNVPAYGTMAVAQFTIALLLELCSHVALHDATVHAGKWENSPQWSYWECPLTELAGKTMGILGFGRIGRQVGRIAAALGMEVLAVNPSLCDEGRAIGRYVDWNTLLSRSDVVSLHCPLFPETEGILNADAIARMKDGAILLNASRGGLVDDAALADALNRGKLAGAGLDVVSHEPILPDSPLLHAKNCIITPHIAWAARECRQRILDTTADNIRAYLSGAPINVVNP